MQWQQIVLKVLRNLQRSGISPHIYNTYEELLCDKALDFVIIASSTAKHYEQAMMCLKHNMACLVEAPVGLNSTEVNEVFYNAEAKGILVVEAVWDKFMSYGRRIKKIIADGQIGIPQRMVMNGFSCGCAADMEKNIELLAEMATIWGTNITEISVNEKQIEMDYFDGRAAVIGYGKEEPPKRDCRIYGSTGYLVVEDFDGTKRVSRYDLQDRKVEEILNATGDRYSNTIKKFIISPFRRYWLDCMNCIAYSLVGYCYDVPYIYFYNNRYTYGFSNETISFTGSKYQSLLPIIDNAEMIKGITVNRKKYIYIKRTTQSLSLRKRLIKTSLSDWQWTCMIGLKAGCIFIRITYYICHW